MKTYTKIIALMLTMLIFNFSMTSVCSAAQMRVCDVSLNDFVDFYNRLAKMAYEKDGKINITLNERPFKNLSLSNSKYTAYTSTVGKDKNNTVIINFIVDKNGYIYELSLFGNTKKRKQQELIRTVLFFCMMSCGISPESVSAWADDNEIFFMLDRNTEFVFRSDENIVTKKVHVDSHRVTAAFADDKYDPFTVNIYATDK